MEYWEAEEHLVIVEGRILKGWCKTCGHSVYQGVPKSYCEGCSNEFDNADELDNLIMNDGFIKFRECVKQMKQENRAS